MKIEINIDDYLSHEEKKEIAKECFKEDLLKNITNTHKHRKSNYDNYERIISNAVFYYLENEIDNIIGTNTKELIKKNVDKTIKSTNYSYSLFRKKGVFESEDSIAQKISDEAVLENKEFIKNKIHDKLNEAIDNMDMDNLKELYSDVFYDFIIDRLTNENK